MAFLDFIQRLFHLGDYSFDRTLGAARSPLWRYLRNQVVKEVGKCEIHGGTKNLEVHHKTSFSDDPSLELKRNNLMVVCRDCHFGFCHLFNWSSSNLDIEADAAIWRAKIAARP